MKQKRKSKQTKRNDWQYDSHSFTMRTRMPFIRRQPPACFDLVDCCDLDLDPLTFISDVDLDMIVTYLHAKN